MILLEVPQVISLHDLFDASLWTYCHAHLSNINAAVSKRYKQRHRFDWPMSLFVVISQPIFTFALSLSACTTPTISSTVSSSNNP